MKTELMVNKNDTTTIRAILKLIKYFDRYSHPLNITELVEYVNIPGLTQEYALSLLKFMEQENMIQSYYGFYYLNSNRSIVVKRLESNCKASKHYGTAVNYSRQIANIPFVQAVFMSNVLSKNGIRLQNTFDFLVISSPGRLWLCRALLFIYKIVFRRRSSPYFSINHIIDSQSLEISEKNLYTATKLIFLQPMYNYDLYLKFLGANQWYTKDYPNFQLHKENAHIRIRRLKKILEVLFNKSIGNWLERKSLNIVPAFIRRKFAKMESEEFITNFHSFSRQHSEKYQPVIIQHSN